MKLLTGRELELAVEYEALGDDPGRRDSIRRKLYELRRSLNDDDRRFNTTGKGRRFTTLCEECQGTYDDGLFCFDDPTDDEIVAPVLRDLEENAAMRHTVPTMEAILRNVSDRARSISELAAERNCSLNAAKFKYFADRKLLLKYFSVRPN